MYLFTFIPTPGSTSNHYLHITLPVCRARARAICLYTFASTHARARSLSVSVSLHTLRERPTILERGSSFCHIKSKLPRVLIHLTHKQKRDRIITQKRFLNYAQKERMRTHVNTRVPVS